MLIRVNQHVIDLEVGLTCPGSTSLMQDGPFCGVVIATYISCPGLLYLSAWGCRTERRMKSSANLTWYFLPFPLGSAPGC